MNRERIANIKIPADAADQQTTDAKSAIPPAQFSIVTNGTANVISITDRVAVQNRVPTASYRVYFLPAAFAPTDLGNTTTLPAPVVYNTAIRGAGRKVANLVADIAAPSLGTVLTYSDTVNVNQPGYYFCVAVNRVGVEAPPEHMISTNSILGGTAASGGRGVA